MMPKAEVISRWVLMATGFFVTSNKTIDKVGEYSIVALEVADTATDQAK